MLCQRQSPRQLAFHRGKRPFDDFTAAMDTAVLLTHAGDVLLFSPGFTSFGMFLNEFDRGDKFVAYVRSLEEFLSSSTT